MKNLLTVLLLVMSLLASGQLNSQSLEVEIKYWKSIAESDDTVAYREYLQRYGEDGLYKDEAITRIALLKATGKQAQSKSIECCFYSRYTGAMNIEYVVRFDGTQDKVWFKRTNYDKVRADMAVSKDFYENQAIWMTDEEYQYDHMKSTAARDVYVKRDKLHDFILRLGDIHKVRHAVPVHHALYAYSDDCGNDEYKSYIGNITGQIVVVGVSDDYGKYHKRYWLRDKRDNGYTTIGYYEIENIIQGYRYIAFSKDKSSFIMWFEADENLDGAILEKREYKRVPKEELLPKAVNYDFLNE